MPSTKKTLHFMSSALVTAVSVGVLGYCMSAEWAFVTMECTSVGSDFTNGTADMTFGLFDVFLDRSFCPSFGGVERFQVISRLAAVEATSAALYGLVLSMLALCMLCSACSILISLYNSVSNPYETYMGPIGLYVCSSLSASLSVMVLILFVGMILASDMAEELIVSFHEDAKLRNKSSDMKVGYYLIILYTVLSLVAIALIVMYERAAYTHRREQQRPTEDAPKEIMMY